MKSLLSARPLIVALITVLVVVLALPLAAQDEFDSTLNVASTDLIPAYLVNSDGMTLYTFKNDAPGVSNCVDGCLNNWPPLTVDSADDITVADGIPGDVDVIEREDTGALQVTYNGWPLYSWVLDQNPGDMTGENFRGVWSIVEPATVSIAGNSDLGSFLVGPAGMTLYLFTVDDQGADASNCTGGCLDIWPALNVDSEDDLTFASNLPGEFSVFEREDDGTLQVAYNGWPLYYWVGDQNPGDATGQNVEGVWFVLPPETVAAGGSDDLGDFTVGPRGMTLYIFTVDEPGSGESACVDDCADNWPPLLAGPNDELTAGEGVGGELGTIERPNGTLQVTLDGQPLYYWVGDQAPGDATGQGVGDVWFVAPLGEGGGSAASPADDSGGSSSSDY